LALINAFVKRKHNFLKVFLPLFTGVLGFTYQVQQGADVNMPIEKFEVYNELSFGNKIQFLFLDKLFNLLNEGFELYIDLVAFLTSLFTTDHRWVLFILGFVYGVILYNLFKNLVKSEVISDSILSRLLLFFIVFFIQPSMAINGRFWLATLLFLNFAVAYYNQPKLKYILWSMLCLLIHKGFFAAVLLFFIWHYTKQIRLRKQIYIGLLVASLLVPGSLMLGVVRQGNDAFGVAYNEQIEGYTREQYIENTQNLSQKRSDFFNIYSKRYILMFYASCLFLAFLYLKKYYRTNENLEDFFYLIILFISFTNFFIDVPSLGSRYRFIATGLMLVFFYKTTSLIKISPYKLTSGALVVSLLFGFVVSLRMEFEHLYGFSYLLNPVFNFMIVDDITIIELIK
jgi:hypothetical protein